MVKESFACGFKQKLFYCTHSCTREREAGASCLHIYWIEETVVIDDLKFSSPRSEHKI